MLRRNHHQQRNREKSTEARRSPRRQVEAKRANPECVTTTRVYLSSLHVAAADAGRRFLHTTEYKAASLPDRANRALECPHILLSDPYGCMVARLFRRAWSEMKGTMRYGPVSRCGGDWPTAASLSTRHTFCAQQAAEPPTHDLFLLLSPVRLGGGVSMGLVFQSETGGLRVPVSPGATCGGASLPRADAELSRSELC